MNNKISVIVPVYNTFKYLEECIESVIKQSIGFENIELILINDGSTDFSEKILHDYEKRYSDNIIYLYQKNQGQSVARNKGIDTATSKYIFFLDSDDVLPLLSLETLLNYAEEYQSDVVCGVMESFTSKGSWLHPAQEEFSKNKLINVSLNQFSKAIVNVSPANKLYLKEFLVTNKLTFIEDIHLGEDYYFISSVMFISNKITFVTEVIYRYRGREASDNKSSTQIVNQKVFDDLLHVYDKIDSLQKKYLLVSNNEIYRYRRIHEIKSIMYRLVKFIQEDSNKKNTLFVLEKISNYLQNVNDDILIDSFESKITISLLLIKYKEYDLVYQNILYKQVKSFYEKINNEKLKGVISDLTIQDTPLNTINYTRVKKTKNKVAKTKIFLFSIFKVFKPFFKDVWIIGDRQGDSCSDNGFYFFKHIHDNEDISNKYFVIKKKKYAKCQELHNMKNIVMYGSIKHYIIMYLANVLVYNDSYRDIFWHWSSIVDKLTLKHVCFLQHGIIGMTKINGYYDYKNNNIRGEKVDTFIVSSKFEKDIVSSYLGYPKHKVLVSGLARFDNLYNSFKKKQNNKIKIVYAPTWRNWLRDKDTSYFENSIFFKNSSKLIEDIILLSKDYDIEFNVCLHHAMHTFTDCYKSKFIGINIFDMSDIDVQEMIISSSILITDYSTISYDFAYQKKPVLFYQFDRERFLDVRHGSFINYETDLFGYQSNDSNRIILKLEEYLSNNSFLEEKYQNKLKKYIDKFDNLNSKRIYEHIKENINE